MANKKQWSSSKSERDKLFQDMKEIEILRAEADANLDKSLSKAIGNYGKLLEASKKVAGETLGTEDFLRQVDYVKEIAGGQKDIKNDKKVKASIKSLNKSWSELEDLLSKQYGKEVKVDKFKLSDFI